MTGNYTALHLPLDAPSVRLDLPASLPCAMVVNLSATKANYQILKAQASQSICSSVLKADGYGVGAVPVALTTYGEGCREFFVAYVDEGVQLRQAFNDAKIKDARIFILNSYFPGSETVFEEHNLIPTLTDLGQIERRHVQARQLGRALSSAIHIDTGMTRTGLPVQEIQRVLEKPELLHGIDISLIISQMVYSHRENMDFSTKQQQTFERLRGMLPKAPASLAKSGAVFLGRDYQYDMVRPGVALHGINPLNDSPNPMQPVVSVYARIHQVHTVSSGTFVVGRSSEVMRVASLAVDNESYWTKGYVTIAGFKAPIVERFSQSLLTVDVSHVPEQFLGVGQWVELAGLENTIDQIAAEAQTIPYEVMIRLGSQMQRVYVGGE